MGDVEISVGEDRSLKVVQHYNLRFLHRRLRGDDLQRRPVVRWWNCRQKCQDDTFVLKCAFVFALVWALSGILFDPFITDTGFGYSGPPYFDRIRTSLSYWLLWAGILFPAMFTAVFALLMKVRMTALPWREEEIKSISLIQHI